jgi:hypothetical protein
MGANPTPNWDQWLDTCWGIGYDAIGSLPSFAGASNLVTGTNPPYTIQDFLAMYPKWGGTASLLSATLTEGSQTAMVVNISALTVGCPVSGIGIQAGTTIAGISPGGDARITFPAPLTGSWNLQWFTGPVTSLPVQNSGDNQNFTIPYAVASGQIWQLFNNGQYLQPGVGNNYTIIGNQIAFPFPLITGTFNLQFFIGSGMAIVPVNSGDDQNFTVPGSAVTADSQLFNQGQLLQPGDSQNYTLTLASATVTLSLPATASVSTYMSVWTAPLVPFGVILAYLNLANACLVHARWQAQWATAMGWFISHFLTLYAVSDGNPNATTAQAAAQGLSIGITVSKSVGDVSVSYQIMQGLVSWGSWNLTIFGQLLITWAKVVGSGPMLLY